MAWTRTSAQLLWILAKHNGKLYGVPIWVRPMTIFYKKSLFDKNGIPEPKTFADLEKALETLKSKGIIPIAVGGKFSWMTMRTTDFLIEHFAGPEMHDKLFALEASYNSPEVVQAFAKLKEWVDKGYFNDGFISIDPNQALPMLFQDKAGMIFQGPVDRGRKYRQIEDWTPMTMWRSLLQRIRRR